EYLVDEGRIERCSQAEGLRKAGAPILHVAVQRFTHEESRDAEGRFLDLIVLDSVREEGGFTWSEAEIRIVFLHDGGARFGQVERASGIDHALDLVAAADLLHFLLEGKAGEQIG